MVRWMVLSLFLISALAGCADDPVDAPTDDEAKQAAEAAGTPVPTWALGDSWAFTDSFGTQGNFIVIAEDGNDWIVGTDVVSYAQFDAENDISYLGRTPKDTLAGSQGNAQIQFFDFPLYHEKTWTTSWDGEQVSAIAHDAEDGNFHLVYTTGGEPFAEGYYKSSYRWFQWLEFMDEDGNAAYRLDIDMAKRGGSPESGFLFTATDLLPNSQVDYVVAFQHAYTVNDPYHTIRARATLSCESNPAEPTGVTGVRFGERADPTQGFIGGQADAGITAACPGVNTLDVSVPGAVTSYGIEALVPDPSLAITFQARLTGYAQLTF